MADAVVPGEYERLSANAPGISCQPLDAVLSCHWYPGELPPNSTWAVARTGWPGGAGDFVIVITGVTKGETIIGMVLLVTVAGKAHEALLVSRTETWAPFSRPLAR